jgi:hypothetical protein
MKENITCHIIVKKKNANILKVLGNSGDEVVTTGFNDLVTNKTVNGVAYIAVLSCLPNITYDLPASILSLRLAP